MRRDREEPNQSDDLDGEDPFWQLDTGASGESTVSERIDEILYDE